MIDLRPESKFDRTFVAFGLIAMWCLIPLYAFIICVDPNPWWKAFGIAGILVTVPLNCMATIGGGYRFVVHGKH